MSNISQKLLSSWGVLVPFTRDYGVQLHASKISRLINLPQRTVARKLDLLEKKKLLRYKREGRNKYYFLDLNTNNSFSVLQILECYKEVLFSLEYLKLSLLLDELARECSVILFGSYAKKRAKESSDVDLVIFARKNKKITEIIKKYPFEVNAHYVTLSLFQKRLKEKWYLAKEIAEGHVLFGEKEKIIKLLMDYFKK